jgi:Abnormal spindle-like microcephaly-assoc'd, ASPM-SPD-2-Hydin
MQLPQLLIQRSPARLFSRLFLAALAMMLPKCTHAATQQLSVSPPAIRFGQVATGESVSQPVVLTNSSSQNATISAISVDDSEFTISGIQLPAVLAPGQSLTLEINFAPAQDGYTQAAAKFTSNLLGTPISLPVNGVGAPRQVVSAAPASLSFGNVPVGSSASLPVVITCKGCAETITQLAVEGSEFSATASTLPVLLTPKNSVTVNLIFKPSTSGPTSGSILVRGVGLNIPVTGTGTTSKAGTLSVSPSQLSFGDVNVGSSGAQSSTLTASGGSVTVSSASSSNGEFSISGTSFPFTISSGQSTEIKVVFAPTATGAVSGSLILSSNASDPSASEAVNGTGVSPQYSVSLSWNASTSSVAGYNVYRGTTAGTYSKLNSALDATTAYTDSTVVSGTTYYYAATSVSSNGQESAYSTPLRVAVP